MDELTYFKLKIVNLEYQNLSLRIEQTKSTAKTAYDNELRKFGLDPEINYRLNDETHSAIPLTTEVVDAPKEN